MRFASSIWVLPVCVDVRCSVVELLPPSAHVLYSVLACSCLVAAVGIRRGLVVVGVFGPLA